MWSSEGGLIESMESMPVEPLGLWGTWSTQVPYRSACVHLPLVGISLFGRDELLSSNHSRSDQGLLPK